MTTAPDHDHEDPDPVDLDGPCRVRPDGTVDCSEVLHRLYHFLDNELSVERKALIQRHLDRCGHCLEAFDFEMELRLVIQSRVREQVPEGLQERIARVLAGLEDA